MLLIDETGGCVGLCIKRSDSQKFVNQEGWAV